MSRLGNSQLRNKRDRPTRVDVTYTLHLPDGTQVQQRLPFVIGVIADLKGDLRDEPPPTTARNPRPRGSPIERGTSGTFIKTISTRFSPIRSPI